MLTSFSSGHGGQTADLDGDEDDGFDEVIYPLDFKQAGHIVDDDSKSVVSIDRHMELNISAQHNGPRPPTWMSSDGHL